MLFFRAKAHDVLHARAVVPAPIENDNLPRSRKMRHVPLHVHLSLLAIRWGGKSNQTEYARADALCDRFNGSSFSGSVAAFKQDDNTKTFVLHPILKPAQLDLKLAQFLCVLLVAHLGLSIIVR